MMIVGAMDEVHRGRHTGAFVSTVGVEELGDTELHGEQFLVIHA
jgi:hypothetical protein